MVITTIRGVRGKDGRLCFQWKRSAGIGTRGAIRLRKGISNRSVTLGFRIKCIWNEGRLCYAAENAVEHDLARRLGASWQNWLVGSGMPMASRRIGPTTVLLRQSDCVMRGQPAVPHWILAGSERFSKDSQPALLAAILAGAGSKIVRCPSEDDGR
jgi:hypothetical protein